MPNFLIGFNTFLDKKWQYTAQKKSKNKENESHWIFER